MHRHEMICDIAASEETFFEGEKFIESVIVLNIKHLFITDLWELYRSDEDRVGCIEYMLRTLTSVQNTTPSHL